MGKIRRRGIRSAKVNPLSTALFSEPAGLLNEDELEQSLGPVEAIREQLQNVNIEEKINGLQSLATYSANKEKIMKICNSNIIRIAAPLLCERDLSVRSAAAGALRNFSVCGTEVCDLLVQQDLPTPLLSLLSEYLRNSEWVPTFNENKNDELDLYSDVFLHAINLLWNLCESSSLALDQLNQTELMEGLVRCLAYNIFGSEIAISVAQCLLVVSENNPKCWKIINDNIATFHFLIGIEGDNSHAFIRSLAAGILCNVPALVAAHTVPILQSLSRTLEVDHVKCTDELLEAAHSLQDTLLNEDISLNEESIMEGKLQ